MSRLRFYLLFAVLYSCWNIGHSDVVEPPPKPVIIDLQKSPLPSALVSPVVPASEDVEKKTTEVPTTHEPEPTTDAPSPSPKPTTTTTTTPPPTTTTEKTTPAPPTPAPVPPTPAPVPPTPAPGPLPAPEQGNWTYSDEKTNVTCIMVQFAAQLNVTYTKVVESATSLANVLLNVPKNATVLNGSCADADQWLTLNWTVHGTNITNNMTVVFHRNDTNKNYGLKNLTISLSPELFVNASSKDPLELYHGAEWQTPLATSYRCTPPTRMNLTSETTSTVGALTLMRLQEEAFRSVPGGGFSAARECSGGDVPDGVPIAVGCALGGLVVVVLVAYLVARRRSAARGYLSM
ncbi:hypothetical protein O3G_MSEX007894 [Manduca sexta]|uniref:Lysosome-associated membrane glycoprotein 5 n=1 Tax=Manduca sexta TaxID=7130 RepID=A0A921ZA59_MANSE|nr:hypothetical protein O3G_MSEX007894 [Manduca sexta]